MTLESASQRFELWAVNLGLSHEGHSSLDYRFRDAPSLFNLAHKLLRDLERYFIISNFTASQDPYQCDVGAN